MLYFNAAYIVTVCILVTLLAKTLFETDIFVLNTVVQNWERAEGI